MTTTCTSDVAGQPCGQPAFAALLITAPEPLPIPAAIQARIDVCIRHLLPIAISGGMDAQTFTAVAQQLTDHMVRRILEELSTTEDQACGTGGDDPAHSAGGSPTP